MAKEHRLVVGFTRKESLFGSDPGPKTDWDDLNELREEDVWGESFHAGDRQEKADTFGSTGQLKNKQRSQLSVEMDSMKFSNLGRSRSGGVSTLSVVQNGGAGHAGRRDGVSGHVPNTSRVNIQLGNSAVDYRQQYAAGVPKSAPVNVPDWAKVMGESDEEDNEEDGKARLPPHEILAREYAKSQETTCSVIEGVCSRRGVDGSGSEESHSGHKTKATKAKSKRAEAEGATKLLCSSSSRDSSNRPDWPRQETSQLLRADGRSLVAGPGGKIDDDGQRDD